MTTETTTHKIEADSIDEAIEALEAFRDQKETAGGSLMQAMASASISVKIGKVEITITIST